MTGESGEYSKIVDYEQIDPFKVHASAMAASTGHNLERYGYYELTASRGESSFVWVENGVYKSGVLEGLGTKNLVTDEVDGWDISAPSLYKAVAQDNIAMIVNDLTVSGGKPHILWMYVAAGESAWFADKRRTEELNVGVAAVCNELGITWAGGESPVLSGIIEPGASELAGFALGEIGPEERYIKGDAVEEGDAIVLVESSGIHANGLSAARRLANGLPDRYKTTLPDGTTFGETLLKPTNLYVDLVQSLLDRGITPKRLENITGHGWRKLMRGTQDFTYRINELPPAMPLFRFMQDHLGVDDGEMFGNYNMGAGFAILTSPENVAETVAAAAEDGKLAWEAGGVEKGPKQVVIDPLRLIFAKETLAVRK